MIEHFLDSIASFDMTGARTFCIVCYGSSFYDSFMHTFLCEVSSFCKFYFIRLDFLDIFLFVSVC